MPQKINPKELVLGICSALLGLAVFWFWRDIVLAVTSGSADYKTIVTALVLTIFSAAFFSLSAIFIRFVRLAYPSALAGTVLSFLFIPSSNGIAAVFLASSLLVIFSVYRVRSAYERSPDFQMGTLLKRVLPLYFTVLAIIISVFYYNAIHLDGEKTLTTIFPKSLSSVAVKIISGQLKSLVGVSVKINPESSVDEVIGQILTEQSKKDGPTAPLSSKLPPSELAKIRQEISVRYKITLAGDEKVSEVFQRAVTGRLENLLGPYKEYLPLILAAALFLALRTVTLPLYYLTVLLDFILIKIAVSANILKKEKKEIEAERLTL